MSDCIAAASIINRVFEIESCEVTVKSATQILRGKLERALRQESPARDLFGGAVAHHADPDALAEAENMLGEDEIRQVKTHLNAHSFEQEAKAKLTKVSPEYEPERRDSGGRGIAPVMEALYLANLARPGAAHARAGACRGGSEAADRAGLADYNGRELRLRVPVLTAPRRACVRRNPATCSALMCSVPPGVFSSSVRVDLNGSLRADFRCWSLHFPGSVLDGGGSVAYMLTNKFAFPKRRVSSQVARCVEPAVQHYDTRIPAPAPAGSQGELHV